MQKIRALLLLLPMLMLIGTLIPDAVYADSDPLTATLYPSDDSYISDYFPGDSNYGSASYVLVKEAVWFPQFYRYRGLVRFDLSSIPAGATIVSAMLKLYAEYVMGSGYVWACRITDAWIEGTVTWNNQPSNVWTGPSSWISTTGWKTWDVTSDVQAFMSGAATNHGWKLITSSSYQFAVRFSSKEFEGTHQDPVLVVTYTLPLPTTITVDCDPDFVAPGGSTTISGQLTIDGTGLHGKSVDLYYAPADSPTGEPTGPWTKIATVTTGTDGAYSYIWSPVPGQVCNYWAVNATFPGDTNYERSTAKTGVLNIPNLHVIPEMPLGTITALVSMTLALASAVLYKRKIVRLPFT